jgi:Leucine-rich repeat (LRR) protein
MKTTILVVLLFITTNFLIAQNPPNKNKEYDNIEEAMKKPELVYKLDLSGQNINLETIDWSKFINIEYLNLKNDHLKKIPKGITKLTSLKVIDLSGNDFDILPSDFSKLTKLEEVYLNDEKNINLPKTLTILAKLPNLKSLHLENDKLKAVPSEILNFKNLENLYLANNELEAIPQIKPLNHLKYLDLKSNNIRPDLQDMKQLNFGFKINF